MQTHLTGNISNRTFPVAINRIPLALVMDACPISSYAMRYLLESRLFTKGEIIILDKAGFIPTFLYSRTPDIVVMDISGRDESVLEGIQIIADCLHQWPLTPVVVCTGVTDVRILQQVKNLGVSSICYKHEPLKILDRSIEFAMAGSCQDSPFIERILNSNTEKYRALTRKEIMVIHLLLKGSSVSEVASLMHRDIRTVSTHKRNAMGKLGYQNDAEMFSDGQWMSPYSGE